MRRDGWLPSLTEIAVNVIGGNLLVTRLDLEIDTRLGTWRVSATYNSATGAWLHSFESSYDGSVFTDPTGAVHSVGSIADGARIPGTHWVKVDGSRVKSLGGLVYEFSGGLLSAVYRTSQSFPRLAFEAADVLGTMKVVGIDQCGSINCSDVFDMTYGGAGELVEITDRTGRAATFSYANGLTSSAKDGLDTARGWLGYRYAYDGSLITSVMNSEGESVTIGYNGVRPATVTVDGVAPISTTFSWGTSGTSVVDDLGGTAVYSFDAARRVLSFQSPAGHMQSTTWGASGNAAFEPTSLTDSAGLVTSFAYPNDDSVVMTAPSGNVTTTTYAPYASSMEDRGAPWSRPVVTVVDSLGPLLVQSFDSQGRLEWKENGEGERTSFTYRPNNFIREVTNPSGLVTNLSAYGEHGHPEQVTHPTHTEDRVYDSVGNLRKATLRESAADPGRPGVVRRTFDSDRNLVSLEMLDNTPPAFDAIAVIQIDRRSDGKVVSVTRPYGGNELMTYDDQGRLVSQVEIVDGQNRETILSYDSLGRQSAIDLPNGMRREVDYDLGDRVAELRLLRGGVLEGSLTYTYESGRPTAKLDSTYGVAETLTYDPRGSHLKGDLPKRRIPRLRLRLALSACLSRLPRGR